MIDEVGRERDVRRRRAEILENARLAVEHDPVRLRLESREAQATRLWIKAMRLAGPSLEVFEALLRDEKVPRSRLDPKWLKSYGI